MYDVLIIGGGPCGTAAAIECGKKGLEALVIEKGSLTESIRRYPQGMTFFSTADNIAIGGVPFPSSNVKPTRNEALQYYRKVAAYFRVRTALYTRVVSMEGGDGLFVLHGSEGERFEGKKLIVATGYFDRPRKLEVPGEELPHVSHYYDEPFRYSFTRVAIVGGGNSAIEAALELYRHDVDVTMLVRGEDFKQTAKYWLLPDIRNRVKEGNIKVRFGARVEAIREDRVEFQRENGEEVLETDFVLALIGYLPDAPFLKAFGIELDSESLEPDYDPENFESNVSGLYLCGTVVAGVRTEQVFIENGREHAKKIAASIAQDLS
jgi:thioredoxin reductase (NADPH)